MRRRPAAIVPIVLSAMFGGALIDWIGRRRCSMIAVGFSGFAVAAIPVADITLGLGMPLLTVLVAIGLLAFGPLVLPPESHIWQAVDESNPQ